MYEHKENTLNNRRVTHSHDPRTSHDPMLVEYTGKISSNQNKRCYNCTL